VTATAPIAPAVEDAYPLTALQAGMLFHSEYEAGTATYHDVFTLTLRARYDADGLRAVLAEIASRHAVLRTCFNVADFSDSVQLVHRDVTIPLTEVDLAGLDADEAHVRLARWREEEKHTPFDWTAPPLIRTFAHRLPGGLFALTLSFHHAILDGWSVASLTTEILARYAARLRGESLPAEPPPVTFRDFVAAERAVVAADEATKYWTDLAADAPVTTLSRLPGYPTGTGEEIASIDATVADDVVAGLERAALALRVPLRTVLLAAHLRVLGLVSGEAEVTTGVITHGRPAHESGQEVLGLFLNTVPMRTRLDRTSWADLITAVFATELAGLPHRQYPLFEILRASKRTSLFETLFDYRDFHVYGELPGDSEVDVVHREFFEQTNLPYGVAFSRSREAGSLSLVLTCSVHQFAATQIEQARDYYLQTLAAIAADVQGDPRDTSRYLDGGDALLIDRWNATDMAYRGGLLHELVAEAAARTPDAPALGFEGAWLSYAQFGAAVNRLARHLCERGVGVGDTVGICLERSADLVIAAHAVVAAGAAYVPLEPEYPQERLAFMIRDAATRTVIATSVTAAAALSDVDVDRVLLDTEASAIAARDGSPLFIQVPADALAYVIYTSGSTGTPKGVGVAHRSIVNQLRWLQDAFGLTGADRVMQKTPFSFDMSVGELFWALTAGAGLVVAAPGGHRDSAYLVNLIAEERVSTFSFVPSMLETFLEEPGIAERLAHVRRVWVGGEAMPPALVDRFFELLPGAGLHNLYGPTETTIQVTWEACAAGQERTLIGHPVGNVRVEVLDSGGQRVPVGVPGELCVGGVQVARGYLNRPGLTADRFVPDRHGRPGGRLYRTGDLARWLPHGRLDYLGRLDHQVKLRGFRIELGEIEAALAAQPEVRSAVVMVRDDGVGLRLVGYLVPDRETPDGATATLPDENELKARLGRTLPEHMIPAVYVTLEELPVTHNGKLDRAALPAPEGPRRERYRAPRDQVEARLAQIWQELLGVPAIGITEDFFTLGGHSLLALRLAVRIRQELGRDLPVATVISSPTIRELAEELRRPEDMGAPTKVVTLRSKGDRPAIFLSHALGGQVFRYRPLAARLGEDQPVYTIPARGLLAGEDPHETLDEMADDYVKYIREVRPHGPYVLGGFCIGGNIALEVARRLRADGEQVPMVFPVWSGADEPVVRSTLEDETMLMIHALAGGVNVLETVDLDELRSLSTEERLVAVIRASAKEERLRPDIVEMEQARRYLRVFKATAHAVGYYKHQPYDGDAVLLLPSEDPEIAPGEDYGWPKVIKGNFTVSPIAGTRFTSVYEPKVASMAAEMRRWMDHGFDQDTTR